MRSLLLISVVMLVSCLRASSSAQEMVHEDKSIVFPKFFEHFPIMVGEPGQLYELDGVTLRAITVAVNDFIPPSSQERQCWDRQEAQLYRVIRQGDIIFVRIHANTSYCPRKLLSFDSGAKYAISADGRILRRVFDGEPEGGLVPQAPDAGGSEFQGEEVPASLIGAISAEPVAPLPEFFRGRDAGSPPDALDGGARPEQDPQDEDTSMRLPEFYDRFPVVVGKPGQVYELDGVTLKALMIALADRYPPEAQARSCWNRPESQTYRVIRQGDIIFVSLGPDPDACSPSMILFDSGVEYAISVDGRILRRRFDGEPNGPLGQGAEDAGTQEPAGEPVPYNMIGVGSAEPVGPLPPFLRRDGGVSTPDGGSAADGGVQDGGTSVAPSE